MVIVDRSHGFMSGVAAHAVRMAVKHVCSCGIGCSRCLVLHGRHHRRRVGRCRRRRGVVRRAGSFVRQFGKACDGALRIRDHIGVLRGLRLIRISRRSASTLQLGFPPSPQDKGCPIVVSKMKGACNSRIIFGGTSLAVREKSGITFINGGNRNGSALMGYVVHRVRRRKALALKRGIRVNCFTRGRTSLLSRGLAIFRAVSSITGKRVHGGVQSLLNTFVFNNPRTSVGGIGILDNKRHAHLTVVGLLLRPIGLLVLSRPAGRLSVGAGSVLGRTLVSFSNALVIMSRSHSFLSKLIAGICRFKGGGMGRRLYNVCRFLRAGGVRDLRRLRGWVDFMSIGFKLSIRVRAVSVSVGGMRGKSRARFHLLFGLFCPHLVSMTYHFIPRRVTRSVMRDIFIVC